MDASPSASTHATSISSCARQMRPSRSACSSTESHRATATGSTSTSRATERSPTRGSTSWFASEGESPTAPSRSPSRLPALRPTCSRSASPLRQTEDRRLAPSAGTSEGVSLEDITKEHIAKHIDQAAVPFAAADNSGRLHSIVLASGGAAFPLQLGGILNDWVVARDVEGLRNVDAREIVSA